MTMSSARAAEDELQQSVLLSAEHAEYETVDQASEFLPARAGSHAQGVNHETDRSASGSSLGDLEDAESEDRDASGEDVDDDVDASGDDEIDLVPQHPRNSATDDAGSDESESDEDDEAVGAVKSRDSPSEDSDQESEASSHQSAVDDDSDEAAWEQDEAGDEDEDDDEAQANVCFFCKQDEENDPSEDFETFLTCRVCKNHAHQQCARDEEALEPSSNDKTWTCPDCEFVGSKIEEQDDSDVDMEGGGVLGTEGSKAANNADEDGARDGSADSTSPTIAARPRRKRKSPSVEQEDVSVSSRKRRRNASSVPGSVTDPDGERSGDQNRSQSRALRLKVTRPTLVTVDKRSRTSLVLTMRVPPEKLKRTMVSKRTLQRRAAGARQRAAAAAAAAAADAQANVGVPALLETPFTADSYSQPFYSFFDKETDDAKGKPYGGILTEAEADTTRTLPQPEDRRKFEQAKQKAEDEWRARVLAMQAQSEAPTRKSKKNDHASQIECIEFGGWEIDTWYAAPYPAEYSRNRVLYICEFCLKYMNSDYVAWRHKLKCGTKHPPGDEIYRHGSVSFFEVDGRKNPVYCQNLCLLAKLFLGSKTLYYDVEPFLFYVLCEYDDNGYHFVGYFSKEKRASSQNNVSCILTLPIHQRKGYGNLLIDFSYLLTKVEEKTGSPEKPLSDMGLVSYRNYWRLNLCRYFIRTMERDDYKREGLSIRRISDDTGMTPDDIISALEGLRALVRDPHTKMYAFRVDIEYCRQYVAKWESKGYVQLKPEVLAWTPYVMGRSNAVNFELGPPINTIAPREDDEAKLEEGPNSLIQGPKPVSNGLGGADAQLENTWEAKEEGDQANGDSQKLAEDDKENATPIQEDLAEANGTISWSLPYRNIPPTRFEVFPAVTHGRRNDRPRVSRPSMPRPTSSAPRPKRPSGSSRRSTLSRPKSGSNSSRRKSGGTGRGPGRWPKGTKKADYGNADSGPGLPPGWNAKPGQASTASGGDGDKVEAEDDESAQDEVRVFVAPLEPNGANGNPSKAASAVAGSEEEEEEEEDAVMAEDIDAEGETE